MSSPKSLVERLAWMAENLPGFRDELDLVRKIEHSASTRIHEHALSSRQLTTAVAPHATVEQVVISNEKSQ